MTSNTVGEFALKDALWSKARPPEAVVGFEDGEGCLDPSPDLADQGVALLGPAGLGMVFVAAAHDRNRGKARKLCAACLSLPSAL